MRTIKFGIIGCGLMGKEFASAAARWCHLLNMEAKPEIIAICDTNEKLFTWYRDNVPTIKHFNTDYKSFLANKEIDAIYCAVPHFMHQDIYQEIIRSKKHFLGEKPFGMDMQQNKNIMQTLAENSGTLVRSSSEFPFYPGAQRIVEMANNNAFGKILEVNAGFLHSSDLDPNKSINWKRQNAFNGEYGCMGDLGMHVFHLPIRLGWKPHTVFATLSKIVNERPDGNGKMIACDTWDNALLHCQVKDKDGHSFPMITKMYRIAPGETDTWYLEIKGTKSCASFSTKNPKTFVSMYYEPGGKQETRHEDLGYTSLYPTITGHIFEFGFTDAILQMWAAFVDELIHGKSSKFICATPEESVLTHKIFSAALVSQRERKAVHIE